jgi:putative ABC transport system substrate-binding protein
MMLFHGWERSMKRRDFLALAVGAAAVSPVRSWAQRTTTIPRVGVLWHAAGPDGEWPYYGCLRDGFEEVGYSQGKIDLIHRFPDEKPERFQSMAAELVALAPDVLVASAVRRPM